MSRPFRIAQLKPSTVDDVHKLWNTIDLDPTYQRQSDIWGEGKRQLFIDSLINGYDIPKLYFHDLAWSESGSRNRYAIIDGKQRLEAIHLFIEGEYSLSDDFEDVESAPGARPGPGLTYRGLADQRPDLKSRFDKAELPVILVQTDDPEYIDEMFSRLNEAVPLNAPEKRNALGGPLPRQIRRLVKLPFFTSRIAFANSRYRHLDLATKFLFIEYKGGFTDLKKKDLDGFVRLFKANKWQKQSAELYAAAFKNLDRMASVFEPLDRLLDSVGMITVYYYLFRDASAENWPKKITRVELARFDEERARNRARVKESQELLLQGLEVPHDMKINTALVQFERFVQSPNDVTAIKQRYNVLRQFIQKGRLPSS